jgi:hypothetical protein
MILSLTTLVKNLVIFWGLISTRAPAPHTFLKTIGQSNAINYPVAPTAGGSTVETMKENLDS